MLQAIIDVVRDTDTFPELSAINTIYRASETGCSARKLLTDFYVYGVSQAWLDKFENDKERAHQGYIDEVLVALATRARGVKKPWEKNRQAYLWDGGEGEEGDRYRLGDGYRLTGSRTRTRFKDEYDLTDSFIDDGDEDEDNLKGDDNSGADNGKPSSLATRIEKDQTSAASAFDWPPAPGVTFTLADRTRT